MRVLVAVAASVAGMVQMLVAPDPFGWRFDFGLLCLAGGLLALPLLSALWLRRSRRPWLGRVGVAGIGLVLLASLTLGVAVVDYRMLIFRRASLDGWREDLRLLQQELSQLPEGLRDRTRQETVPALAALDEALPHLSEDQRHVAVVKAIAGLSDGHSIAFPFFPATDFTLAPLQIRWFADGWFVIAAGREHADVIGARIVRIGALPVAAAFDAIRPYVSADNEAAARVRGAVYMLSPRFWKAIGYAMSADELEMELEHPEGSRRRIRIEPTGRLRYLWWYLEPHLLWKRRHPWSMTAMPARKALHIELRSIRHEGSRTMTLFAHEVLDEARRDELTRIVIDVRGNSGGDNTTFRGFVDAMAGSELNRRGRLFLLTDGGTFSAATNFVTAMERRTSALRVGTATGSGPNHFGDSRSVLLPRTRIFLLLSTRYHQFGERDDTRRAHEPDVLVEPTSADYFAGRDRALEAALNWR